MKLAGVTSSCGMKTISVDPELVVLHGPDGAVQFVMSKHIDDFKFAGTPEAEKRVMDSIRGKTILHHTPRVHELWREAHTKRNHQPLKWPCGFVFCTHL